MGPEQKRLLDIARHHMPQGVAENYRFDPLVRLTRALLDVGAIGMPTLLLDHSVGSGGRIVITPWRHKRLYGGTLLDVGVHNVDLMAYYLGRVETVNARVSLLDTVRVGLRSQGPTGPGAAESPGAIYAVTNANLAVEDTVTPDVEDTALATLDRLSVCRHCCRTIHPGVYCG